MNSGGRLGRMQLAVRWMAVAFLLWESASSSPRILSQPVPVILGQELIAAYFLVSTGLAVSRRLPSKLPILAGYDLLFGSVLLWLYGGAWPFVLPFFMATYTAAAYSWTLSLVLSVLGAFLFTGSQVYAGGVKEELLLHPQWLLVVVLSLALTTLGILRLEAAREKEKSDSLIGLIESGRFGSAASYEDLFKLMRETAQGVFSGLTFALYLKEESGNMKLQAAEGLGAKLFGDFNPREVPTRLTAAIAGRGAIILSDASQTSAEEEKVIPKTPEIRSAMAVPLVFGGETAGLVFVGSPVAGAYNGESARLFWIVANQAAVTFGNVKLREKAALLIATDSVSGLYTYGYMQEFLEREFNRCKYANLPLCALILDVDGFGQVNEAYGHAMGDAVLRQIGAVIKGVTRASDAVCRYAADEFMIILPETNRIGAMLVAERVRQAVQDYEFVAGSSLVRLTLSGGIACYPQDVETRKEITEKAEQNLAAAKKQGGHGVVL